METSTPHQDLIDRLRAQWQPRSLLCLGCQPAPVENETLTCLSPDAAIEALEGRHDLVLVAADLPTLRILLERGTLARLRDLLARRLVVVPECRDRACRFHAEALLRSLGLRPLREGHGVWYHDLYDYKETPDWLNPRYWANPELWDRYRW